MIKVIGAGLAGCEAAWRLANDGFDVELYEMKPQAYSPAHRYDGFAELVCSNSLKSSLLASAGGLLKEEMRLLGSLTLRCADECAVPAGGALAVDRKAFSDTVTKAILSHPRIRVVRGEVTAIPDGNVVIATGPLTSSSLAEEIRRLCGGLLSFYDAAAPIVATESVNTGIAFAASRYEKGDADYLNCPMNREEYEAFHESLIHAETAPLHDFERAEMRVYEGCMPVEVLAKRGADSIRFGPLKPVGLRDPRTGHRPWAVVQLRKENATGTMVNLVGFQTNLRFGEQERVFRMIPGLANAEFIRFGVMHRNTFLDSPRLLNEQFRWKEQERCLYFAGQITGVEGYMESAASGILAGLHLARELRGELPLTFPDTTMLHALSAHVSDTSIKDFQPMGASMGLLPPLPERVRGKRERYEQIALRSLTALREGLQQNGVTGSENHS